MALVLSCGEGGLRMNNPLSYQISEYDCGPTTLLNAISFLIPRKQIPPDIIKYVQMYCMDGFNGRGQMGKTGTSRMAMSLLVHTLNQYSKAKKWPLYCHKLETHEIELSEQSPIIRALREGGVAILRVYHTVEHYILLTGVTEDSVYVFDPYYEEPPVRNRYTHPVEGAPDRYNYISKWAAFNRENKGFYSMGKREGRECLLLFNQNTRTPFVD